ncbi:MAG: redoxin domain-containing protein, partial [Planctomycetaceae bacterium]|nr:redoxin domain-containing protein [Planctomycetaceae bacterium]
LLVFSDLFLCLGLALAVTVASIHFCSGGVPVQRADPAIVQLASFRQETAPSFEGVVEWINSRPISFSQLRGKIVLLDFWTYCCINCHHVLPALAKLEAKYKKELVIIGVHSGKFSAERNSENIRRKVAEYRIKHPVANDANMVIWERFEVSSWPTLILIGPDGRQLEKASGEVPFETLDRVIGQLVATYRNQLNLKPLELLDEQGAGGKTPLLYPGKVLADAKGSRLFVSDTGHNRIVQMDLRGASSVVIGSGQEGLGDGDYKLARFNRPQGICLDGEVLYIADTENHAIRAVDLKSRQVSTVAGIGKQAHRISVEHSMGPARTTALSSPWDITRLPGSSFLYIAMAGLHQIWKLDPEASRIGVWAGSGIENIRDGDLHTACFAQPSGLATDGENVFVADSEVSGIRVISRVGTPRPRVGRIVGEGLFEFGDADGAGTGVRLQHCLGVAFHEGRLYIADTYNNKIKVCNPKSREVKTFAGDGTPGSDDDPPRFYQPGGLSASGSSLYVADTNNHKIRVIDLQTHAVKTLDLKGLEPR